MNENGKLLYNKSSRSKPSKNQILPKISSVEEVPVPSSECQQQLQKVPFERDSCLKQNKYAPSTSQYFVLPAGGMHFAIPDLNFRPNHFEDRNITHKDVQQKQNDKQTQAVNISSESFTEVASWPAVRMNERQESHSCKEKKLPYVVELTAGPGQNKNDSSKKGLLPSETLFATASIIKSYFMESGDKSDSENDESVKNKMIEVWNSVKYGWATNMKTNFSRETHIFMLGKEYHKSFKENQAYDGYGGCTVSNIEGFKDDFRSIPWFTYRKKFMCLPESTLTTDCGWGCMIRSGQMMMATALTRHFLLPGWRYDSADDGFQALIHRQIMKWFCDVPFKNSPFSLHNLILSGHKMNKKAGNWYGPSCVSHMLKDVLADAPKTIPALENITVYVAQDGAVYIQDVLDLCCAKTCICTKCDTLIPSTNVFVGNSRKRTSTVSSSTSESNNIGLGLSVTSLSADFGSEPYSVINCDKVDLNSCVEADAESNFSSFCKIEPDSLEENKCPVDLFVNLNRETYNRTCLAMNKQNPSSFGSKCKEDEICDFCQGWKSCLILIPVRLGGATVNPIYYKNIYSLISHDLCVGLIGGRPKHSLYFVGFQDNSLIHLDPHYSQDVVPFEEPYFPLSSFHCSSPKKIPISKMDPSATIGFYCHTQSQFFRLIQQAKEIATAKDGSLDAPVFEFVDGRCLDMNCWLNLAISEETEETCSSNSQPESLDDSEILVLD